MPASMNMMSEGQVVVMPSGHTTNPFPRVNVSTERSTASTLKRVQVWLLSNAADEVKRRGLMPVIDTKRPQQADRDLAEMIVFGEN